MKYIRLKNGHIVDQYQTVRPQSVVKRADTIEELCDQLVSINKETNYKELVDYFDYTDLHQYINYGAIWTDKGLIYVAKMNEKGELELL